VSGYDIIGDVHGNAEKLEGLLRLLGYVEEDGAFVHPDRQAIFFGDLIDRGGENLRVVDLVQAMEKAGTAQVVMGNHEFNAIAYATEDPERAGEWVRPHTEKNRDQHEKFLREVKDDEGRYAEVIAWFKTRPFWLDLEGEIGVVHACWRESSMDVVRAALADSVVPDDQFFIKAATKGNELYEAMEVLLKGPELELEPLGLPGFLDPDGNPRWKARIKWWVHRVTSLAHLLELGKNAKQVDGSDYPAIDAELDEVVEHEYEYHGDRPVFFGHYWRTGEPVELVDWNHHAACVDYSAGAGGPLIAYRWSGEATLSQVNFVAYPKQD
jgi:hypothetical protein